nr:type II toxin-antitoxin system death-on-curing family toxin [Paraburkholderia bryophila]
MEIEYVITAHDEILRDLGGLGGFAGGGRGGVESALARVENHATYNGIDDVFGIAAMYTIAIAQGHVFNDGNKRTGLTCALAYLKREGITIPRTQDLENAVVGVARHEVDHELFAQYLSSLWSQEQAED